MGQAAVRRAEVLRGRAFALRPEMTAALAIGLVLSFALLSERTAQRKVSGPGPRAAAAWATVGFAALLVLASRELAGTWDLLPLAVACGFWFLSAQDTSASGLAQGPGFASGPWAPILAGLLSALSVAWIWGSLQAVPVSDEAAYLLQARIFAIAAGAVVLAVTPLWSYKTVGDWRTTPYYRYSRVYYPYQWTEFTFDETPSLRPHPPEMEAFDSMFRRIQHEHRLSALPEILEARLEIICRDLWGGGRRFLLAFAVLGLLGASAELLFAVAAWGVLVLAYLVFAHWPGWSVYYMEGHPALALATASGLDRVLSGLPVRFARAPAAAAVFGQWAFAAVFLGGLILPSLPQMALARDAAKENLAYQTGFRRTIAAIADRKSVVFVKYAAAHDVQRELVSNDPDLASSQAWIVYDRGPRNEELIRLAPGRVAYVCDDARRRLLPTKEEKGR
jgi:hypothetical protein